MDMEPRTSADAADRDRQPAIRFLVESALRKVKSGQAGEMPADREGWVERLCEALMSESETSHRAVIASLMATGIDRREFYEFYVPSAARRLGEMWVKDEASFVDVTVGGGRLQALFRDRSGEGGRNYDRVIPLGESFLMAVPAFEQHSLGAFVAADQLRRHGVWVHMGIGLTLSEIADVVQEHRFAAVGLSLATWNTVEKATEVVDYLRSHLDHVPPIVVGGRAVTDRRKVAQRTGADFAVRTAREAIERCGLATTGTALTTVELD